MINPLKMVEACSFYMTQRRIAIEDDDQEAYKECSEMIKHIELCEKEKTTLFVVDLGDLLKRTNTGVAGCVLSDADTICVYYYSYYYMNINVFGCTYGECMYRVLKCVMGKDK